MRKLRRLNVDIAKEFKFYTFVKDLSKSAKNWSACLALHIRSTGHLNVQYNQTCPETLKDGLNIIRIVASLRFGLF